MQSTRRPGVATTISQPWAAEGPGKEAESFSVRLQLTGAEQRRRRWPGELSRELSSDKQHRSAPEPKWKRPAKTLSYATSAS